MSERGRKEGVGRGTEKKEGGVTNDGWTIQIGRNRPNEV